MDFHDWWTTYGQQACGIGSKTRIDREMGSFVKIIVPMVCTYDYMTRFPSSIQYSNVVFNLFHCFIHTSFPSSIQPSNNSRSADVSPSITIFVINMVGVIVTFILMQTRFAGCWVYRQITSLVLSCP